MLTKEMIKYLSDKLHEMFTAIENKEKDGKVDIIRVEEQFILRWDELTDLYLALGGDMDDLN